MGNKNTGISFKLDRLVNFTNESVTGHVHLDLEGTDEYSNINSIYVIIKGIRKRNYGNKQKSIWKIFTSAKYILASPQQPGTKLNFTQGHYSWPFSVSISAYLPPSYQTQAEHLYYSLEVIFNRSWFQRNTRYSEQIIICPHVNLQRIPNNPLVFGNYKQKSQEIIINGKLNKSAFIWGEKMKLKLEIFNTKRLLIKNINISLFYTVQSKPSPIKLIRSSKFIDTILEQIVPSIENTHEEMISKSFEMQIPTTYSPPSFKHSSEVNGYCIWYDVKSSKKIILKKQKPKN
jgi:hypothetical protein